LRREVTRRSRATPLLGGAGLDEFEAEKTCCYPVAQPQSFCSRIGRYNRSGPLVDSRSNSTAAEAIGL